MTGPFSKYIGKHFELYSASVLGVRGGKMV